MGTGPGACTEIRRRSSWYQRPPLPERLVVPELREELPRDEEPTLPREPPLLDAGRAVERELPRFDEGRAVERDPPFELGAGRAAGWRLVLAGRVVVPLLELRLPLITPRRTSRAEGREDSLARVAGAARRTSSLLTRVDGGSVRTPRIRSVSELLLGATVRDDSSLRALRPVVVPRDVFDGCVARLCGVGCAVGVCVRVVRDGAVVDRVAESLPRTERLSLPVLERVPESFPRTVRLSLPEFDRTDRPVSPRTASRFGVTVSPRVLRPTASRPVVVERPVSPRTPARVARESGARVTPERPLAPRTALSLPTDPRPMVPAPRPIVEPRGA